MKKGDTIEAFIFDKWITCEILEMTKKHAKIKFEEAQWIVTIDKIRVCK
jgi:16S rRNA U1498 N3-methylase RsmE